MYNATLADLDPGERVRVVCVWARIRAAGDLPRGEAKSADGDTLVGLNVQGAMPRVWKAWQ